MVRKNNTRKTAVTCTGGRRWQTQGAMVCFQSVVHIAWKRHHESCYQRYKASFTCLPWDVFWWWSKHNEHIHYPRLEHPVSVDLITSSLWGRSRNKIFRIWARTKVKECQPVCLVELRTLTQQIQECPEKIFFVSVHFISTKVPHSGVLAHLFLYQT